MLLVPLLHKYSFLWTKARFLQCDVIVHVGELPPGKVGDEFEAFVGVTLRLDVSDQSLERRQQSYYRAGMWGFKCNNTLI